MLHSRTTSGVSSGIRKQVTKTEDFLVSAIGSCRVLAPLKLACGASGYKMNQAGIYGYCHSSTEARQQVDHLQNRTLPPEWLCPVVAPNQTDKKTASDIAASDLYFVELCSSKILTVDGHAIQLNYLTRHFQDFFKDRERARIFWGNLRNNERSGINEDLKTDEIYRNLSDEDQAILIKLRLRQTTPDILVSDINRIKSALPNVIFITHFDVRKHDGALLKARAEYLVMLRNALDECKCKWFDPSDYVAAFGQAQALEEGDSLSHYSEEFIELLANNWMTRYIKPNALMSSRKQSAADRPLHPNLPLQPATAS